MFLENVTVLYLFDFLFKYSSLLLKEALVLSGGGGGGLVAIQGEDFMVQTRNVHYRPTTNITDPLYLVQTHYVH